MSGPHHDLMHPLGPAGPHVGHMVHAMQRHLAENENADERAWQEYETERVADQAAEARRGRTRLLLLGP